ncbi:MAG: type II toxin-antitoxin system HicA family toxin [Gammaproteobacteria bacterium]
MSHKHDGLLRSILDGPACGNVHWREVESMLTHLGAKLEPHHGASFRVQLNGIEGFLHRPHNSATCTKQELRHLRAYLLGAGLGDAAKPEAERGSSE